MNDHSDGDDDNSLPNETARRLFQLPNQNATVADYRRALQESQKNFGAVLHQNKELKQQASRNQARSDGKRKNERIRGENAMDYQSHIIKWGKSFGVLHYPWLDSSAFSTKALFPLVPAREQWKVQPVSKYFKQGLTAAIYKHVPEEYHELVNAEKFPDFAANFCKQLNAGRSSALHVLKTQLPKILQHLDPTFRATDPDAWRALLVWSDDKPDVLVAHYPPLLYSGLQKAPNNVFKNRVLALALRCLLFGPASLDDNGTRKPASQTLGHIWQVYSVTWGSISFISTLCLFVAYWATRPGEKKEDFDTIGAKSNINFGQIYVRLRRALEVAAEIHDPQDIERFWNTVVFKNVCVGAAETPSTTHDINEVDEDDELAEAMGQANLQGSTGGRNLATYNSDFFHSDAESKLIISCFCLDSQTFIARLKEAPHTKGHPNKEAVRQSVRMGHLSRLSRLRRLRIEDHRRMLPVKHHTKTLPIGIMQSLSIQLQCKDTLVKDVNYPKHNKRSQRQPPVQQRQPQVQQQRQQPPVQQQRQPQVQQERQPQVQQERPQAPAPAAAPAVSKAQAQNDYDPGYDSDGYDNDGYDRDGYDGGSQASSEGEFIDVSGQYYDETVDEEFVHVQDSPPPVAEKRRTPPVAAAAIEEEIDESVSAPVRKVVHQARRKVHFQDEPSTIEDDPFVEGSETTAQYVNQSTQDASGGRIANGDGESGVGSHEHNPAKVGSGPSQDQLGHEDGHGRGRGTGSGSRGGRGRGSGNKSRGVGQGSRQGLAPKTPLETAPLSQGPVPPDSPLSDVPETPPQKLNNFTRAPEYIAYLAYILTAMPGEEDRIRTIAGYLLKNNARLILTAAPEQLMNTLDSTDLDRQEAAFNVLEKACEDYPPKNGRRDQRHPPPRFPDPKVPHARLAPLRNDALPCDRLSLPPVGFQSLFVHIDNFIATLFKLASDDDPSVRRHSPPPPARLHGLRRGQLLWLDGDAEDAAVPDKDTDIKPRHYGSSKSHGLKRDANGDAPKLRIGAYGEETIDSDDEDDYDLDDYDLDDEDFADKIATEWNLRKCAAAALDVLAVRFGGGLLNVLLGPLKEKLWSTDWLQRESGILALGAMAEGYIAAIEPHLINTLSDPNSLFRSIICWTLGCYASWTTQPISGEYKNQYLLLWMVFDNNKRAGGGCSVFATLEEDTRLELAQYLQPVLQNLVIAFDKFQHKNMLILYDAVSTLADAAHQQNSTDMEEPDKSFLIIALDPLSGLLGMELQLLTNTSQPNLLALP
ncbi:armadillo-type protein [Mycena vitilis]|nr:armadillo-type protein [Mycena vitilis]